MPSLLDWQIVYVKREESDKGVVAAGMIMPTLFDTVEGESRVSFKPVNIGDYFTNATPYINETKSYNLNKRLVNFISPEINFRETESLNFDFFEIAGEITSYDCVYKDRDVGVDTWSALTCKFIFVASRFLLVFIKQLAYLIKYDSINGLSLPNDVSTISTACFKRGLALKCLPLS